MSETESRERMGFQRAMDFAAKQRGVSRFTLGQIGLLEQFGNEVEQATRERIAKDLRKRLNGGCEHLQRAAWMADAIEKGEIGWPSSPVTAEQCRTEFEKAATDIFQCVGVLVGLERNGDGYLAEAVQGQWEAWQVAWNAALRAQGQGQCEVCDQIDRETAKHYGHTVSIGKVLEDLETAERELEQVKGELAKAEALIESKRKNYEAMSSSEFELRRRVREMEEGLRQARTLLIDVVHGPESAWNAWLYRRDQVRDEIAGLLKGGREA